MAAALKRNPEHMVQDSNHEREKVVKSVIFMGNIQQC